MKNKALIVLTSIFVMILSISCFRITPQENALKDKTFCDSCNTVADRLFFKWQYEVGYDDKYLDSIINIINYAVPKCDDEESKYKMSLLKLSALCAKNDFDKAFVVFDSINFDDYEYSCYRQVIFNRIYAMKYQYTEEIPERNLYLQQTVDLLHDYLSKNKLSVNSVWLNNNESTHDSLWLATFQYYHYFSILKGYKNAVKELDSLYDNNFMNEYCHERLVNESECAQLRIFLGI